MAIVEERRLADRRSRIPAMIPGLLAACLFGATAPLCKVLLNGVSPLALASLLYLGSGLGLTVWLIARRAARPARRHSLQLSGKASLTLAGAVLFGGALAPVLFLIGLSRTPASSASLLLNLELVFTACLAWTLFREGFEGRVAAGLASVLAGCVVLAWPSGGFEGMGLGSLAVAGACMCWGLDNNLTQRLADRDALQIAAIKGIVGGSVNAALSVELSQAFPQGVPVLEALCIGFLGYGLSLVLFVVSLGLVGTARTGGVFAAAPFVGVGISVAFLREEPSGAFLVAALLVLGGLLVSLSGGHAHRHSHEGMVHVHLHRHDDHHQHDHAGHEADEEPHSHEHAHEATEHAHPHFPDTHHRHAHY